MCHLPVRESSRKAGGGGGGESLLERAASLVVGEVDEEEGAAEASGRRRFKDERALVVAFLVFLRRDPAVIAAKGATAEAARSGKEARCIEKRFWTRSRRVFGNLDEIWFLSGFEEKKISFLFSEKKKALLTFVYNVRWWGSGKLKTSFAAGLERVFSLSLSLAGISSVKKK